MGEVIYIDEFRQRRASETANKMLESFVERMSPGTTTFTLTLESGDTAIMEVGEDVVTITPSFVERKE